MSFVEKFMRSAMKTILHLEAKIRPLNTAVDDNQSVVLMRNKTFITTDNFYGARPS